MNRKKLFLYMLLLATLFISACSDDDNPIDDGIRSTKALLILSEGKWNENNSTLSRYDLVEKKLDKDYFLTVNKRGLGDTGNDMIQYGSKIYVVVNVSSTIEVLDAATGKSIRQIDMKKEDGKAKEPRQVVSHKGKVYVTSYDQTVTRIDTVSLAIDGSVKVGMNPEDIIIKNNKLYVANSGFSYDNTVSVIDIESFKEEKKIEVGSNPVNLGVDSQGDVYIALMGTYGDNPEAPSFKRIDSKTEEVKTIGTVKSPGRFVIYNNKAYIINGTDKTVTVYDCLEEKVESDNFIKDDTKITSFPYSIAVDEKSGEFFISETDYVTPGTVYCFNKEGKLQYRISSVGINPTAVITLR
ncbi:DUF5074 domain-containing protein [Proteiniphilum sp.]|uniref:DUF5074 domain-containing protein n=1 Tax=Proteiniphilum sp. TaxID=1926877 RepID=UPI002B1F5A34|nr:DUF5074 domain-containing protein [Proteiniphilum sp.]MEA4918270.1 hypothetical protein [Proteiniphilum sp.]